MAANKPVQVSGKESGESLRMAQPRLTAHSLTDNAPSGNSIGGQRTRNFSESPQDDHPSGTSGCSYHSAGGTLSHSTLPNEEVFTVSGTGQLDVSGSVNYSATSAGSTTSGPSVVEIEAFSLDGVLEDFDKVVADYESIPNTKRDNNITGPDVSLHKFAGLRLKGDTLLTPEPTPVKSEPPSQPAKNETSRVPVPAPRIRPGVGTAQPHNQYRNVPPGRGYSPNARVYTEEIEAPMKIDDGNMGARPKTYSPNETNTNQIRFSQKSTAQIRPISASDSDLEKRPLANQMAAARGQSPSSDLVNRTSSGSSDLVVKNKNESDVFHTSNESSYTSGITSGVTEQEAMGKYRLHLQAGKLKESQGKTAEAAAEFEKAIQYGTIARGENSPELAKTMGVIGRLYHKRGKHNEARKSLERELEIYVANGWTSDNHPDEFWATHDILAQVYDGLKNSGKEIEHYEKAIEIVQATTVPPERLPHMHNNVGNAYRAVGNLNKAKEHLETAKFMMGLMHCDEAVEDMAKVHSSLGDVYHDMRMIPEAIEELEACVRIREKTRAGTEGELIRGGTHQTLAALYEQNGDKDMHEYHLNKSKSGLKGLMGSEEERESLLQNLAGMVKGQNATGVLGKLAAGLTASSDINKAQQYQAENNSVMAIEHYRKGIASMDELPPDIKGSEEILSTLALCHNNVGNAYRKIHQFKEAEQHLSAALDIRRRLFADEASDDTASTLFNLGHLLQSLGGRVNIQRALDLHEECLRMYLLLGGVDCHMNWIVSLYRSLGQGYERLSNSRKSIENYEKAKDILIAKGGDLDELRAVCNNMGNSYESIGDYAKAEENIQMALNMSVILSDEKPHDLELQNHIAAGHNNLGVLYQTWGKLELALKHLYESRDLRKKIKDENMEAAHDVASSYHNIGNTLIKMGKLDKALENYEQELEIRTNLGEDTSGVRVAMSNVHERLGNSQRAVEILHEG